MTVHLFDRLGDSTVPLRCLVVLPGMMEEAWMPGQDPEYTSVEICAGAGGQALGLHQAGFRHRALIEIDKHACGTLRKNLHKLRGRDECQVLELDLKKFTKGTEKQADQFNISDLGIKHGEQIDLLAGGVPCPPFSLAGRQLGQDDERDLFPVMLNMVEALQPRAVMIENVRGLLVPREKFAGYRMSIISRLEELGYETVEWGLVEARNFGVPQLRPRAILIALQKEYRQHFPSRIPQGDPTTIRSVADALEDSMWRRLEPFGPVGKERFERWRERARQGTVAPTLVGGSKKHGGADLGPSRAKQAWDALGVDAHGVADEPLVNKERDLFGPRGIKLTVRQAAIIQGFPEDWEFDGRKTAAYRQVGNAFPPPVARAMGEAIFDALRRADEGEAPLPPEQRTHASPAHQMTSVQESLDLVAGELTPA